jgi:hypothetical protein
VTLNVDIPPDKHKAVRLKYLIILDIIVQHKVWLKICRRFGSNGNICHIL